MIAARDLIDGQAFERPIDLRDYTPVAVSDHYHAKEHRMTTLHQSTFDYLKPTEKQMDTMAEMRSRFADLSNEVERLLPDGPDKTYVQRHLRSAAMWANVAITRNADGSPRT